MSETLMNAGGMIRCLSLWQPWASLVVMGIKEFETRGWATSYRGPLLIHAAKTWNRQIADYCLQSPLARILEENGIGFSTGPTGRSLRRPESLPFGALIGRVDLIDVCPVEKCLYVAEDVEISAFAHSERCVINKLEYRVGDYTFGRGRFAWKLANHVQYTEPFPYIGRQGMFNVPTAALEYTEYR